MGVPGTIRLTVRVALASIWAGLLVLAGLWAVSEGLDRFPMLARVWRVGGVTVIAMGQFLFSALVADRLFPHASRRLAGAVQAATGAALVLGLVALAALTAGVWP